MPVLLLLAALGLSASGCTTARQSFPDHDASQVWTALVAVAQTPDYRDPDPTRRWHVRENQVWVDEEIPLIEIYRELDRVRYPARMDPRREHRTWRFRIILEKEDPPTAQFVSRGWGVPMHASEEARRFFMDVIELLESSGEAAGAIDAPAPPPAPAAPADDDATTAPDVPGEPAVDIDDLDDDGR
jgi:hypothetical protein